MASRFLWISIAILLAAALFGLYYYQSAPPPPSGETARQSPGVTEEEPAGEPVFHALVSATDSGFSPAEVTIKKGETVRFVNNQSATASWVASAVHPTHTVYPGSGIAKCGTVAQSEIFDTCRGLAAGESWEFTFDHAGTWRYHDHLHTSKTGTIVVTE